MLLLQEQLWQAAQKVEELLISKASVLSRAVAVDIDTESRCLTSLPLLLGQIPA